MTTCIQLRKARIRNLKQLYQGYCIYFNGNLKWSSIIDNNSERVSLSVSFPAAISMHLLHIAYSRLSAIAGNGSISSAFQSIWNPLILEILANDKLVGAVFLERCSTDVLELEALIIWGELEDFALTDVISKVIEYSSVKGASKIIMKTSDEKLGKQLDQCGFNLSFCNSVMSLELDSV